LFYDLLGNLFTKVTGSPAVVIGRMAGQFAKPRSETYETVDGKKVYSFKGENVNGFHAHERTPCPKRLTEGHLKSMGVMNHIRQMKHAEVTCAHFLEKVKKVNQETFKDCNEYSQSQIINEPLPFDDKVKVERDVYVSHEALMLDYEETQVRIEENKHYNLSAHFLWIGMRTNMIDGAHVEFFRGIENPIGIKLSKEVAATEEDLKKLIDMIKMLNPKNEAGKLVLIARFGARYVEATMPKVLKAVLDEGLKVLWVIDAVHGNTQKIAGFKTRKLEDVREEIITGIRVFREFGAKLHGVHLELTPEEVTECLGGSCFEIKEDDLGKNYTSLCDPRLNFSQSIELINAVAQEMSK
jgi:3-deoxy-7-phosphoheptulonate synthase